MATAPHTFNRLRVRTECLDGRIEKLSYAEKHGDYGTFSLEKSKGLYSGLNTFKVYFKTRAKIRKYATSEKYDGNYLMLTNGLNEPVIRLRVL